MRIQKRFRIQEIIEGLDRENTAQMMFYDNIIRRIPNESKITLVEQPMIILGEEELIPEEETIRPVGASYIYFNDIKNASTGTIFIPTYCCDNDNILKSIVTEQLEVVYRDRMYMLLKYSQIKDNDYYEAPTFFCFEYDNDINSKCRIPCSGIRYENIIKYDRIVSLDNDLRMFIDFESCKTMVDTGDKTCETCKFNPNDANYTCHDVNLKYEYPRKTTVYPKDIDFIPRDTSSEISISPSIIHSKIIRRENNLRHQKSADPYQVYLDIKFQTKF